MNRDIPILFYNLVNDVRGIYSIGAEHSEAVKHLIAMLKIFDRKLKRTKRKPLRIH